MTPAGGYHGSVSFRVGALLSCGGSRAWIEEVFVGANTMIMRPSLKSHCISRCDLLKDWIRSMDQKILSSVLINCRDRHVLSEQIIGVLYYGVRSHSVVKRRFHDFHGNLHRLA